MFTEDVNAQAGTIGIVLPASDSHQNSSISPLLQVLNNRNFTEWWLAALLVLPWLNPFSPGPSPAVTPWLVTLGCLAFVLLGLSRVRLAEVAASAWLAAALISALLGLLQYFGAAAVFGPWVNSAGMGEAFANLRQRNQFATLTNIGLAALLWWVARCPAMPANSSDALPEKPRNWLPTLAIAAAVLLAVGNAASSSRTGLVQLAMLLVLAWVWSRGGGGWHQPSTRRVLVASALAYATAAVALPLLAGLDPRAMGILARLHAGDSACGSRLTLWGNVLHLIAQKPWLGWGWGELSYAHFITLYPGVRFCDILDNAHNLPLHLAVELGLPLAAAVCGVGAWVVWRAKPWLERDATRQLAWTVVAVILLHSLLEYPLWYGPFQVAFGLSIWFLWRSPDRASDKSDTFRPIATVLSVLVATVLIAITAYAGWDYYRISQIYLTPDMRAGAYRDNTQEKISDTRLFQNPVHFAELTTTPVTAANAAHLQGLATSLLHFSPEPRVVEKLIESDLLLGRDAEARFYRVRYQAAFPESYGRWAKKNPD